MTLIITCYSIAQAHETLVKKIMNPNYSREIETENGELTKEITDVRVKITSPLVSSRRSENCFMKIKGFITYAKNLIYGYDEGTNFEYDYNQRLRHWGKDDIKLSNEEFINDWDLFDTVETDQIQYIISKLQEERNSRRAIAITWIPPIDERSSDVPCLQFIQCLIRDDKLEMYVLFRSEDIVSGFGQNAYGLTELQKYIASKLNISVGDYYHYIVSAHAYYIRDSYEISKFQH